MRYTLKKYNINAIWFLGEIIPAAPVITGLFNPTIEYYIIINICLLLHFFRNFSLRIANALAISKKLSIILNKENPIYYLMFI